MKSKVPYHAVKGSLDSGLRYRTGGVLITTGIDEEGRHETTKKKTREKETGSPALPPLPTILRSGAGSVTPAPGQIKLSNSARSTKHGSFDFERPGWNGALMMRRSGSGGTNGNANGSVVSGMNANGSGSGSVLWEKEFGPGMAGVGTLQREQSMRRVQDREEGRHDRDVGVERGRGIRIKEKVTRSQYRTTDSDQMQASTSTTGTGTTNERGQGKTSSLSKATGKRYAPGRGSVSGNGGGLSRPTGSGPHLGLFSFEPAVSVLNSCSAGQGTSTKDKGSVEVRKEYERVERERERQKEMKRRGVKVGGGDRPPVPVPIPVSLPGPLTLPFGGGGSGGGGGGGKGGKQSASVVVAGHRSGTKGRSLDLGLGLAWASSKVPEEALLPSSTFMTRTSSSGQQRMNEAGSLNGHSLTGSSGKLGDGDLSGDMDEQRERAKLGKEVANVFKSVLDEEGYKLFKRCNVLLIQSVSRVELTFSQIDVHQFDAHEIPFDGPNGIIMRVERLLMSSSSGNASAPTSTSTAGTKTGMRVKRLTVVVKKGGGGGGQNRKQADMGEEDKQRLLDKFVRIILQQA